MENYLLIINPISGTGSKEGLAQYAIDHLTDANRQIHVSYTTAGGDATRMAREAAGQGFNAVIAVGGDGTVNETATALCDTGVPLGIIPMGSGNGLARHLGIPIDPAEAIGIIADNNIIDCDYCKVNDRPFFCTFGIGFDAAVSEKFAQQKKRGRLSYIKSAISEYISYNPQVYTISANGHVITQKAFIVACCNASQYGNNAYIAPDASMTDGLMDITIVHAGGTPLDTAIMGVDLFTGYINRNTMIRTVRTRQATIRRSEIGPAHIDGEPITMDEEMKVSCHPGGLRVFTPGETHVRPIITPLTSTIDDIRVSLGRLFRPKHLG